MKITSYLIAAGAVVLLAGLHYVLAIAPDLAGGVAVTAMALQTAYNERMAPAVAGFVANMRESDRVTRNCETAAGIGFGLAVGRGTDKERGCVLAGALPAFLGVSIRDIALTGDTVDEYAENGNVGVLTMGEIWVQVTGNPDPSDPVHYDATTGVFAASGGSGPILGARWTGETHSSGIAKLHLSGYGQATS